MNGPPPLPQASSPVLTYAHFQQIAEAQKKLKKIRRAISVANFDGWTIGIFGGLSLMFGMIGGISVSDIIVGLVLAGIALVELRTAKNLRRLDVRSARILGFNQLALAALIILYSLWRMHASGSADSSEGQMISQVADVDPGMASSVRSLTEQVSYALYGSLILFAILAQGGTALYYFSREKYLRAYVEQTPQWILQMQQSPGGFEVISQPLL
ncbi:MAG TPA: hypothetical protein VH370_12420 [Humisphaera sp.]|nr:hypothetical protein [Humisphaera sp.]